MSKEFSVIALVGLFAIGSSGMFACSRVRVFPARSVSPQPVGVEPRASTYWQQTLDEEFTTGSINTSLWNYGYSNDHNCRLAGCIEGILCAGSDVQHQRCNDDFNFAHDFLSGGLLTQIPSFNNGTGEDSDWHWGGEGTLNSATKFVQRYGYFETRMKLPPNNAAASGMGSAFWAVSVTSDSFVDAGDCNNVPGGRDEVDIAEDSNGGTGLLRNGSQFTTQSTIWDCSAGNAAGHFDYQVYEHNGQDLSATFHVYGLNWINDGSRNGTMCFYLDGVQQGCHTLSAASAGWTHGIFLLQQAVTCYPGGILGGGSCTSNGTEGLQTDYVRVWQAVPY